MRWLKRVAIAGIAVCGLAAGALADDGDGDHDHDRARDLYERGEIHALFEIMRVVKDHIAGDIVGVELVPRGDLWVYRFQIVTAEGRRTTLDVDARAASIIRDGGGD